MKLQIDEMRESVRQQNEAIKLKKLSSVPKLSFERGRAIYRDIPMQATKIVDIQFEIKNYGSGDCFDLKIMHDNVQNNLFRNEKIKVDDFVVVSLVLNDQWINKGNLDYTLLKIQYSDNFDNIYNVKLQLLVLKGLEESLDKISVIFHEIKNKD